MLRRPRLVLTVCPRVKLGALTTVFFENLTNVSLAFNVVVIFGLRFLTVEGSA